MHTKQKEYPKWIIKQIKNELKFNLDAFSFYTFFKIVNLAYLVNISIKTIIDPNSNY